MQCVSVKSTSVEERTAKFNAKPNFQSHTQSPTLWHGITGHSLAPAGRARAGPRKSEGDSASSPRWHLWLCLSLDCRNTKDRCPRPPCPLSQNLLQATWQSVSSHLELIVLCLYLCKKKCRGLGLGITSGREASCLPPAQCPARTGQCTASRCPGR